ELSGASRGGGGSASWEVQREAVTSERGTRSVARRLGFSFLSRAAGKFLLVGEGRRVRRTHLDIIGNTTLSWIIIIDDLDGDLEMVSQLFHFSIMK
ncbi:MAG: hypothetical protein AAF191_16105, partial [Verrucomicrobiota bacterium]